MALNQQNFATDLKENEAQSAEHLKAIQKSGLLSFFKAMNYYSAENVMVMHITA